MISVSKINYHTDLYMYARKYWKCYVKISFALSRIKTKTEKWPLVHAFS